MNESSSSDCEFLIDQYIADNYNLIDSSEFYPKIEKKKKLKNKYFFCKYCHSSIKFTFIENNLLKIKCDCKKVRNIRINDFIEHYSNRDKNMVQKYFYCKNHKNSKYINYCRDCKMNLCKICSEEDKTHINHSLDSLVIDDKEIEKIKQLIKEKRKKLSIGDIENRKILNIIEALIKKYKEYPSHNFYISINNAIKFLKEMIIPNIVEKIKIRTKKELYEKKNLSHLISSIKINNQNYSDLSLFKELNLMNLEKLQLQGNGIKSIEPFLHCNFEKLKFLDLEDNKLNDESFKDFDKLNFKNIRYINLYKNEIKSPTILEKVKNYPTLKTYFAGENLFSEKEINNNKNKEIDLTQLKKIGLTGNFSDKTIDFMSNLKFSNLQIMYISRNNLTSLKFLKNVHCENLVSFWAINNKLTNYNDILELPFKEEIEKINLKGNKINNIDNLLDFIKHFPKLKELILKDNPINIKNPHYKKIINEVKNKKINLVI